MTHKLWLATIVILSAVISAALAQELVQDCGVCGTPFCESLDAVEAVPRLMESATVVFVGIVVKAETLPRCDRFADVTFRIKKSWPQIGRAALTVRTGSGCGRPFPFAIGQDYLLAVDATDRQEIPFKLHCGFGPKEESSARAYLVALAEWSRSKPDGRKPN